MLSYDSLKKAIESAGKYNKTVLVVNNTDLVQENLVGYAITTTGAGNFVGASGDAMPITNLAAGEYSGLPLKFTSLTAVVYALYKV